MAANNLSKSVLCYFISAVSRRKKDTFLRKNSPCTNYALNLKFRPGSRFYRSSHAVSTATIPSLLQPRSDIGVCNTLASAEYKPVENAGKLMRNGSMGFHSSNSQNHKQQPSGTDDVARTCWNCGRDTNPKTELFFCDCGVVQKPAEDLTYFKLMQMQKEFDIDLKKLSYIFKETQKFLHPDKFTMKSKEEQKHAEKQSSLLNKAYSTLQKPLSRAIYLLKLENITISETDSIMDPEFLMEIMEINEQISSASKSSDVEAIEAINNSRITKCVDELKDYFNKNLLNDAKNSTVKLRYYTTIDERIKELYRKNLDNN